MTRTRAEPAEPSPSSLERLLETEARLDALLIEARTRADELVLAAERGAAARLAALEAELGAFAETIRAKQLEDRSERLTTVERSRADRLDRLQAIGDDRIEQLAAWVVEQVAVGSGPPP